MAADPFQAIKAANRGGATAAASSRNAAATVGTLLIAGATGVLGHEVMRRLSGSHRYAHTVVLAKEPILDGIRGIESALVPDASADSDAFDASGAPFTQWPLIAADTALVLFDPPRLYYQRERALWAPAPEQLPDLARWLRACGVRTLAVVQPHAQGNLPEALKRGLANLDEHAVATLGFDRVIFIRSAQKPKDLRHAHVLERLAAWMLSIVRFMVPTSEQPVRASKVAELVDQALMIAPPGVHVAAPELVWRASQGDLPGVARGWLHP